MNSWVYLAGLCAFAAILAVVVIAWAIRWRQTRKELDETISQAEFSDQRPVDSPDHHDRAREASSAEAMRATLNNQLQGLEQLSSLSGLRERRGVASGFEPPLDGAAAPQRAVRDGLARFYTRPPEEKAGELLSEHMAAPTGPGPNLSARPAALKSVSEGLIAVGRLAPAPTHLPPDDVICSVFAPPEVRLGAGISVQAYLHLAESLILAARRAAELDPAANRRGSATLRTPIRRGSLVQLYLDSPALIVRSAMQDIEWQGRPARAVFKVQVPTTLEQASVEAILHVGIDDIPIGEIAFTLHIDKQSELATASSSLSGGASTLMSEASPKSNTTSTPMPLGSSAHRYETAFISYSRRDFPVVSFFAQGLGEKGIAPCIDVSDLEPGDEWAEDLPAHIARADVFYLMWSDSAAASRYVDWESRHAVDLYREDRQPKRPRIKPIPLHQPWPQPPEYLKPFHFYSVWQGHRAAPASGLTKPQGEIGVEAPGVPHPSLATGETGSTWSLTDLVAAAARRAEEQPRPPALLDCIARALDPSTASAIWSRFRAGQRGIMVRSIYTAVVGQPMLAHKAVHEGKVAAEVTAGRNSSFDARVIPSVAYTDPEVAWVGLTENEAKAKGVRYGKGVFPWAASGRSLSLGRDEGVTKVLFDEATGRIIGCGIVGPNAGDLIAEAGLAIEMGADAHDIGLTIHPHPTLSETIAMAAEMFEGSITDLIPPKRKSRQDA